MASASVEPERSSNIFRMLGSGFLLLVLGLPCPSLTLSLLPLLDPSVRLTLFRNRSYKLDPVEAQNRQAQNNRNDIKGRTAHLVTL